MHSTKPKQVHTWALMDGTFRTFPADRFFLLFSQTFIDPVSCPDGILQGRFILDEETQDGDWMVAVWNADCEVWDSRLVRPTHYSPLPEPPMFVEVSDTLETGFRFRLVKGQRHSGWATYTAIAYLDGMAAVTGYYAGNSTQELKPMQAEAALQMIAVKEDPANEAL